MVLRLLAVMLATLLMAGFPGQAAAARFIVTGAGAGGGPHVIIRGDLASNGTYGTVTDSFYAFSGPSPLSPLFSGGVRVATGDFDGDGNDELVTAMGLGGNLVRTWRLTGGGKVAELLEEFAPFGGFTGGIYVAAGDFDGDGRAELVTAADAGGGPQVIVWRDANQNGRFADDPPMASFFAYPAGFTGGVRVAAGDVDNDGKADLITAAGPGGGPDVRIFKFSGGTFMPIDEFFAYPPGFSGGVFVAAGPIDSAGNLGAEVITGAGAGGGPHVRIFTDTNNNNKVSDEPVFDEFFAYAPGFIGGVVVASGDTDHSAFFHEVLTAAGPSGGPHVRIFDDTGDPGVKVSDNPTTFEFFAFDPAFTGGVFLAVARQSTSDFTLPGVPIAIPDTTTINPVMCLPPGSGIIRELQVSLAIFHSFDGDLDVSLTHIPSGTSIMLFNDVGATNEGFFIRLGDNFGTSITVATNPKADGAISGNFRPVGLLSSFKNLDASGCWQLTITDDSGGDTGSLFDWTLHVNYGT